MSEEPHITNGVDTMQLAPSPTDLEVGEKVRNVIGFFQSEFGLGMTDAGELDTEPTTEQLASLKDWHERTTADSGLIMPDFDTFTAKMILARALMPQVGSDGKVQYLFGKGAGAELALQGAVAGRSKRLNSVPYRTHSDFEIYAAVTDQYESIEHNGRFTAVFGSQEIYPVTATKGLKELPENLLHDTAETVSFGGVSFLVPSLEAQFVDKFEKTNESVERGLRDKTDAEWLASAYELDGEKIHTLIDNYVIAPQIAKLAIPEEQANKNLAGLTRQIAGAKRRYKDENPQANDSEINTAVSSDFFVSTHSKNMGIDYISELIDQSTGELVQDSPVLLLANEQERQTKARETLTAKHQQVDELLALAA